MAGINGARLKKLIISLSALFLMGSLSGQNPIVPPGVYIADPSAHAWKDGKLYVYGSRDESPKYFCSWRHDVLSTADLKTWTITPNAFASKGPGDEVSYSDAPLYAPDCQFWNGTYYLFFCIASGKNTEGVATSKSPVGPFTAGKPIDLKGINEIDPCVFIDDDGQAYYIWGQFQAKVAKMKPGLTEIDTATIHDNVVTEKDHFFHEGGYMIKRNGIYYFIYADMSRSGRPTCIGYSTGKSPFGPFTYGGVIIDNDRCDPGNWNNHGSVVEFIGQWFVFYHRATHNSFTMRKACVEPIEFRTDGSIKEAEMTTQGASGPLNPVNKMDAERACLLHGNVRVQALTADNEELAGIRNDDKAAYKYFDFGAGVDSLFVQVTPGLNPGKIDIAIDAPWGESIGIIDVPGNGDGKMQKTLSCKIRGASGKHALWLRFSGKGDDIFSVDWFQFSLMTK
jgi:hypothetical protein